MEDVSNQSERVEVRKSPEKGEGEIDNEIIGFRCRCKGVRYIFVIAAFLGMCILYMLRVSMSIAIVAMVNQTVVAKQHSPEGMDRTVCGPYRSPSLATEKANVNQTSGNEFTWSPKTQGLIVGSFYYGYVITQIPGAKLAAIFGGKWVFGLGIALSSLLSLSIPEAARFHPALLAMVRALMGLAQGCCFPAMYTLLGRWTIEREKTLVGTMVVSGVNIGTVIGMPLAAKLTNTTLWGGWPAAFYITGFIGCVWFLLWCISVSDDPRQHMCMTEGELNYIIANQKIQHAKEIPWLAILTFPPYWSAVFTQFTGDWTFYLIVSNLPRFYSTILNFNIETNGYVTSLPYLLQSAVGCSTGYISDEIIKNRWASVSATRKICNSLGCVGAAIGLFLACVVGCDISAQISAFSICVASQGLFYGSYMVSYLDMSPEYAGTLVGIANTFTAVGGFVTPIVVGALTEKDQTIDQWRIIFGVTAIMLVISMMVYHLFSVAEKQDWQAEVHTERVQRLRNCLQRWKWKQEKETVTS